MSGYQADREWSDGLLPALRHIVGPLLVEPSTLVQDREQAADLTVFTARSLTIACRVRRPGYSDSYPWDFTIRARRNNGVKTELAKIVDGWGDWFLYGHADQDGFNLARWMVLDLNVFRSALIRSTKIRERPEIRNPDRSTTFVAYDVREFPQDIVIAARPVIHIQPLVMA
jgi:hypothetical protein